MPAGYALPPRGSTHSRWMTVCYAVERQLRNTHLSSLYSNSALGQSLCTLAFSSHLDSTCTGNGNDISRFPKPRAPETEMVFPAFLSHVHRKRKWYFPPSLSHVTGKGNGKEGAAAATCWHSKQPHMFQNQNQWRLWKQWHSTALRWVPDSQVVCCSPLLEASLLQSMCLSRWTFVELNPKKATLSQAFYGFICSNHTLIQTCYSKPLKAQSSIKANCHQYYIKFLA